MNRQQMEYFHKGNREIDTLTLDGIKHPIYLRRGTSDIKNVEQVLIRGEYRMVFEYMKRPPKVILDLGAYAGYSMIYFKHMAPKAKVICIEPEMDNYRLLMMNAWQYKNVYTHQAAVWHETARLTIYEQFDGDWGNRLCVKDGGNIKGLSIPDIMGMYKIKHIDLLKMDIEMAEKAIFEHDPSWIKDVDCVACETHDRYLPGCREAFDAVLHEPEFEVHQEGETRIAVRR